MDQVQISQADDLKLLKLRQKKLENQLKQQS
jgi:hypothetical protein